MIHGDVFRVAGLGIYVIHAPQKTDMRLLKMILYDPGKESLNIFDFLMSPVSLRAMSFTGVGCMESHGSRTG